MKVCRVPTRSVYKNAPQQAMKSIEDSFKKKKTKKLSTVIRKTLTES